MVYKHEQFFIFDTGLLSGSISFHKDHKDSSLALYLPQIESGFKVW